MRACVDSFFEGSAAAAGVDAELVGLAVVLAGVGPMKLPNNEDGALAGLVGATILGGGWEGPLVSVVLGLGGCGGILLNVSLGLAAGAAGDRESSSILLDLAGASDKPSIKFVGGSAFGGGGTGRLGVDAARSDDCFANLAFSWTIFSGCPRISINRRAHAAK